MEPPPSPPLYTDGFPRELRSLVVRFMTSAEYDGRGPTQEREAIDRQKAHWDQYHREEAKWIDTSEQGKMATEKHYSKALEDHYKKKLRIRSNVKRITKGKSKK
jgi:hypothetical protein